MVTTYDYYDMNHHCLFSKLVLLKSLIILGKNDINNSQIKKKSINTAASMKKKVMIDYKTSVQKESAEGTSVVMIKQEH